MKMIYGGTPVKSLKVKHYEVSTNDATLTSSDLQSGVTAYAKGQKVTGTGKAFEFASYGLLPTNASRYVPSNINIIEISSLECPIKSTLSMELMKDVDFSTEQTVATAIVDDVEYSLVVSINSNILTISCDETINLYVFYGKDNYV